MDGAHQTRGAGAAQPGVRRRRTLQRPAPRSTHLVTRPWKACL